jgi:hypothetical protein
LIELRCTREYCRIGLKRWYFWAASLVAIAAIGTIVIGITYYSRDPRGISALPSLVLLVLPIIALPFALRLFQQCRFDRVRGEFIRSGWGKRQRLPLGEVVAVEFCSGGHFVYTDRETGDRRYPTWQINLLTRAPDHPRITVSWHGDEQWTRSAACRLAEFLQVPLQTNVET